MAGADPKHQAPVPVTPLNEPARAFLEAAVASPGPAAPEYRPTDAVLRLAETLFTSKAESFLELADAAGVHRSTIWRLLQDQDAVKFIVERGTAAAAAGLSAVHARLLHLALTSKSPAAIDIYLKRFDPEYRHAAATDSRGTINAQFAQIFSMSPNELENFVKIKQRQGGFHEATPAPANASK